MPSQPVDTGWGFNAVIDLIESDYDAASPTLSAASPVRTHVATPGQKSDPRSIAQTLLDTHVPRLGDFSKLFDELGISRTEPLAPASPVDSEGPISSDDALLSGHIDAASIGDPDSPLAALSAKEQKKERKRAAKQERKQARRALKASVSEESASGTQPINQPRPRSNVGAKIRPATPASLEALPQALKPLLPARVLDFPRTPADSISVAVSPQRLNSLAQPFAPASTSIPHLKFPPGAVDDFAKTPAKQVSSRPSLHEAKSNPGPQLRIPSSVHFDRGLVPRTVQSVSAPRVHTVSSGKVQGARTPVPAAPRFGTAAGQKTSVRSDLEPTATPASQTPYQLQSPNRLATPVQISSTPGGGSTGLTIRPRTDRHFHFLNQLLASFPENHQHLLAPMRLTTDQTMAQGIHCFVDASNIMIGFRNILRERGQHQPVDLSFDTLALLMERRRPVAKRIYASSQREANPLPHVIKLAETSKAVGYENLIQEQVFIRREDSDRKKFFKDVERLGWTKATQLRASGSGSDSETGAAAANPLSAPKWVEQGVDEILHLKMCQSVLDTEVPTTMVLATGDGNAAEHSDGFLANVERALKKGWRVELVSWKQQMSAGYRNRKFRAKWGEQFRTVELDDYLESLIDT
ncbi:uncharacterized protein CC84DRAFT_1197269 [Paraphaeosphaeria sporulosa]|uniref:NYN domain-containing protein n=1 Tax=Paraphaeosphaeria sporulosa TaxID=1460663 RepID=A0A177C7Z3_9PLEO|nr:uncharacterized protein CC84DRAFT_1197269 [Paraphaeosphaeria sporulosa]OAG03526.1 hypothetical protein CC84DRAFT_1197269 [Paraphaeosphaeria sporulosa]